MRFLVDMPLSPALAEWLSTRGHEAIHAFDAGLKTASDAQIIRQAARDSQVVITCDLDFPPLLATAGQKSPGLVLLRGGNYSDRQALEILERVLRTVPEQELARSLVVVDQRRLRRIRLPVRFPPPDP